MVAARAHAKALERPAIPGATGIPTDAVGTLIVTGFLSLVAGYHLSFLFRSINATLAPALMRDLALDRAALGLITAAYFLTFAAAQIPLGIALDRFGPRRVQTVLLLVAAIGSGLTAVATDAATVMVARGVIGLGVATALMAGIKANAVWFPGHRKALANGAFMALGAAGTVAATYPVEWALAAVGWRGVMGLLAGVTGLLALVTFVCVPELPAGTVRRRTFDHDVLRELGRMRFWGLALMTALVSGTGFALHGLWIERWLTDVARLPREEILPILYAMGLVLSVSAAALGIAASEILRRGGSLRTLLGSLVLAVMAGEFALATRYPIPVIIPCCVLASTVGITVVIFTYAQTVFPTRVLGTLNGILNTFNMGGAFVVQASFGFALSHFAGSGPSGPATAYLAVFVALMVAQVLAFAIFMSATLPTRDKAPALTPRRSDARDGQGG